MFAVPSPPLFYTYYYIKLTTKFSYGVLRIATLPCPWGGKVSVASSSGLALAGWPGSSFVHGPQRRGHNHTSGADPQDSSAGFEAHAYVRLTGNTALGHHLRGQRHRANGHVGHEKVPEIVMPIFRVTVFGYRSSILACSVTLTEESVKGWADAAQYLVQTGLA